jgi:hypothetical protein
VENCCDCRVRESTDKGPLVGYYFGWRNSSFLSGFILCDLTPVSPPIVQSVSTPFDSPLPSSPSIVGSPTLPGYHEPEDDEPSLHAVLDSLLPFIHDPNSSVQLPVYLGNSVIDPGVKSGESSKTCSLAEGVGKEFAWSRGLGIDYSPVKMRSARKNQLVSTPWILILVLPLTVGHLEQ